MVDYDAMRFWWDVLISALLGVNILYTWITNRSKANTEKIDQLEVRHNSELKEIKDKIGNMEGRLQLAIGSNDLKPVFERLNGMDRQLSEIGGKMHTLDLIHEILMGRKV